MFESIWQDIKREYAHGTMVSRIIMINVAVWFVVVVLGIIANISGGWGGARPGWYNDVLQFVMISSDLKHNLFHPWVWFTNMFLHESLWHILWNMLFLYWFGRILGDLLGDRKILPVYIMGGLVAGLMYFITANLFQYGSTSVHYALGASGAVMAIVAAAGYLAPDYNVRLILIGNVRLKYIVLVLLVIDIVGLGNNENTGGHFSHLGGAMFGGLFIYLLRNGTDLSIPFNKIFDKVGGFLANLNFFESSNKGNDNNVHDINRNASDQERLDTILIKIKEKGYDSLSAEEKDFLYNASKK